MEIFPEVTMTVAGLDRLTGITDPGRVAGDDERHPDPEVPARARRRTFTAQYKQEILAAYEAAPDGEKGAILRREGLYSSHVIEWRRALVVAAVSASAPVVVVIDDADFLEPVWPSPRSRT
jgi:transposase